MIDNLFAVWMQTEGLDLSPILCTTGNDATQLAHNLCSGRVITAAALVSCCQNDDIACPRDAYDPAELNRPTEILMRCALATGIPWPADLGQHEPEYSVLQTPNNESRTP